MKEFFKTLRGRLSDWASWEDKTEEFELCEGVTVDSSIYELKESRISTLILKGIIVYLLTMGGMGCYLTAVGSDFSDIALNIILLITAVMCSVMYYSFKFENISYLIFFVIFVSIVILLRNYLNSGYYAVINDTLKALSDYFRNEGTQQYNERIGNRYLAITVAMAIIGVVFNILLNNYISRRMRYLVGFVLTGTLLFIPLYMKHEPDTFYEIMLLTGLVSAYFYRGGGHYKLHRSESIYGQRSFGLGYSLDSRIVRQMMLLSLIFVTVIAGTISIIFPKEIYDASHKDYIYKTNADEYVENFISYGFAGIFNFVRNTGGLSSGLLGKVSAVHLDYQTDIVVTYAPYSYDTVYIKNFTGTSYVPYENYWLSAHSNPGGVSQRKVKELSDEGYNTDLLYMQNYETLIAETETRRESYEAGDEYAARGMMKINNLGGVYATYTPYYSDDRMRPLMNSEETVTFYPAFSDQELKVPDDGWKRSSSTGIVQKGTGRISTDTDAEWEALEATITDADEGASLIDYLDPSEDIYLEVPEENIDAVRAFSEEAGLSGTPEEIIDRLDAYFEENIPYTIRPGATPRNEDFVNDFLIKKRKGYCSYFASAGTLILRYNGIPARYVEGYAVSYFDVSNNGELAEDEKYEDYYDGYSELGRTAVVTTEVSDASAHAWIEAYIDGKGWVIVDLTPPGTEEDTVDFWSNFARAISDGDQNNVADDYTAPDTEFQISDRVYRVLLSVLLLLGALTALGLMIRALLPRIRYSIEYRRAGLSDRLVMEYSSRMRRAAKRDPGIKEMVNYRMCIRYLSDEHILEISGEDMERLCGVLEQAGFSSNEISPEDYIFAHNILERKFEYKRHKGD